ncbi:hypothetical protein CIL05_07210 [Virgibacillus profundi]|uniref:DGQHR domain-containing protein n=1 Tax=Virgibacillus profundi TaxID=2024555 RepID=A0A2A2IET6_9BACI|nr:DNA sulfur modification protein DndB [Virgibacillus profundi]PAV30249.1 hypothetical protein CIL05_07210 [Virgibacillus profundi]PXY54421.1 hypothetical protein CIT14_07295 [Virgibacillus profundi]
MKQDKTRQELEENLIQPTLSVKRKRKIVQEIKDSLFNNHKIIGGNTQSWINDPETELPLLDWRILYLFAKQIHSKINQSNINPDHFYTEVEAKKAQQYTGNLTIMEDVSLPMVFNDVTELRYGTYLTHISAKLLAQMSSTLLNYNFDIQREATKITRNNETIKEATLVLKNVLEIKSHLKQDSLESTNIVFNAAIGTADDGDELTYNPETKQLQINKGTIIDIVDGYHRCKGSELALNENPDINFKFSLIILNYTDDRAANYQGQLAEATPMSKPKKKQLSSKRHSDAIVRELMTQSELKDKVAVARVPSARNKELVTYDVLSDTIDEQFKLDRMIDVHKVTNYLKTYFNILLGEYAEQFIENPIEWKKKSVMVENNMFIGYIVLARRMYELGIDAVNVIDYIDSIDFDKNNELWQDIGFLNEDKNLNKTMSARNAIENYFKQLEL